MKPANLIAILIAFSAIIASCSSPTEVPAHRAVTVDSTVSQSMARLEAEAPVVDLGEVVVDAANGPASKGRAVIIHNRSAIAGAITSVRLTNGKVGFSVSHSALPFNIGPLGSGSEEFPLLVTFTPHGMSKVHDILVINDSMHVELTASGREAQIYVVDIDFGSALVGTTHTSTLLIVNESKIDATLMNMTLMGPDAGNFALQHLTPLPTMLKAGTRIILSAAFQATAPRGYQATVMADIEPTGIVTVDNVANLTGMGL